MSLHQREGVHIVFGMDPIGVCVTLSCMQDASLISEQIGTKFAWK